MVWAEDEISNESINMVLDNILYDVNGVFAVLTAVVSIEVVFPVDVYGVVSTVPLSVLCNSVVNVVAGIVVLMLEDVAVVCTIAVVF